MIVGTTSGMHLLTRNSQNFFYSWIMGALVLLIVVFVLLVLAFAHFKNKKLRE